MIRRDGDEVNASAESARYGRTARLLLASGQHQPAVRQTMAQGARIPAPSLAEGTFTRLRHMLIVGEVRPGQQMTLGVLARLLGTSPTPVRDALSRLATADALQQSREFGVIVPTLGAAELEELHRLRIAVEGLAFANAAEMHRKADWRAFKLLHTDVCRAAETARAVQFASAVWALRVALLGLSEPSVLSMFVDRIWCRFGPTFTQKAEDHDTRREMTMRLGDIVEAIGQRDPSGAERAVIAEIDGRGLYRNLEANQDLPAPPLVPNAASASVAAGVIQSGAHHV
ncbi:MULTISPECIES: GntR family transcriptional regulator [unclassified Bradyrhizobium]|uniref:GntR family transcriptional regulator n=1 Tax=unclassified Bradyrhizobium TaxID=2631580 RepID=UPI0028E48941|nr:MULTISPECIES: GntR family transcriptional regulator [unclassified Bradyrhizobium]